MESRRWARDWRRSLRLQGPGAVIGVFGFALMAGGVRAGLWFALGGLLLFAAGHLYAMATRTLDEP